MQEGGHFLRRLILPALLVVGLSSPATAGLKPAHAWLAYLSPDSSLAVYVPNEIRAGSRVVRLSDEIVQAAGAKAAEEAGKPSGACLMFCFRWMAEDKVGGAMMEPDSLEIVLGDGRRVRAALLVQGDQWTVIRPDATVCLFALFPSIPLNEQRIKSALVHWNGATLPLVRRAALR